MEMEHLVDGNQSESGLSGFNCAMAFIPHAMSSPGLPGKPSVPESFRKAVRSPQMMPRRGRVFAVRGRWQYGLGRSVVFTSDAKARWAEAWVAWPGFDKFWAKVTRDLLPHAQSGQAELTHDTVSGRLVADYRLASSVEAPAALPALYFLGPDGFQQAALVERISAAHYRASVAMGNRRGLLRIRPLEESRAFPETGIYLPEPELTAYGSNPLLLKLVSAYTGGRFQPTPKQVFHAAGRSIPATMRLWPGLLALAMVLNLLEVAWRRLRPALRRRVWGAKLAA